MFYNYITHIVKHVARKGPKHVFVKHIVKHNTIIFVVFWLIVIFCIEYIYIYIFVCVCLCVILERNASAWVKNINFKNKIAIILSCVLFYIEASNQLTRRNPAIFSTSGSCEKSNKQIRHLLNCQLNYDVLKSLKYILLV